VAGAPRLACLVGGDDPPTSRARTWSASVLPDDGRRTASVQMPVSCAPEAGAAHLATSTGPGSSPRRPTGPTSAGNRYVAAPNRRACAFHPLSAVDRDAAARGARAVAMSRAERVQSTRSQPFRADVAFSRGFTGSSGGCTRAARPPPPDGVRRSPASRRTSRSQIAPPDAPPPDREEAVLRRPVPQPPPPISPSARSRATTRAASSSGCPASVASRISGSSGASYGASIPVIFWILPRRARA